MVNARDKEDSQAIEIADETEYEIDKDGYTKDPATDPWNEHISVQVSSIGRFNMGANPNPENGGAQTGSFNMMYFWPSNPGTSYSTVRVDGQDFVYGSSGTVVQPPVDDNDAGTNRSSWMLPSGIKVTQTLTIVEGQGTGKKDTAEIRYELENTSAEEHNVGMRIMIDSMLDRNDGALFRVPGLGNLTTEREFVGEEVPDYFLSMKSFTDSEHVAASTFRGGAATPPDKVIIGTWPGLVRNEFDYTPSTSRNITWDSAYAVYWTNRSLPAGEKVSFVNYYGAGGVTQDLRPPLGVNMFAPTSLSVDEDNVLAGNPFTVSADVRNLGNGPAQNVVAHLESSPEGLEVEGPDSKNLGTLDPGQEKPIKFRVKAPESSIDETYTLSLIVSADEVEPKTVQREIFVPANGKGRSYVAIGDSTSTGHSISICQRSGQPDAADFEYVYGCPVEPQDRSAYPDLLAERLGSPYEEGYTVAEPGDYRTNPDLGPPGADLNRVGVWGSTIRQMVDNYEQGLETGTGRRGDTPWEAQLHAVDDAEILVTTLHGASDMRFADIPFWAQKIGTFQTKDAADNLIKEINAERPGGRQSYMDAYFEVLDNAEERGAKVVVGLYYNPYHERYTSTVAGIPYRSNCGIMHGGARTITNTLNAELKRRVNNRGSGST